MIGSEPPSMRPAQSYSTYSPSHFSLEEYSIPLIIVTNSDHFDNCIKENNIKSEDSEQMKVYKFERGGDVKAIPCTNAVCITQNQPHQKRGIKNEGESINSYTA